MSIDKSQIEREGGERGGRYVYRFADGAEAEMVFVESRPGIVTITHTGTPVRHRGQGVAAALVARAVSDFRAAEKSVIPACGFAAREFRAHPEWADLPHDTS